MEEAVDLRKVYIILKQKILLILVTVIISVVLGAIISIYMLTPIYESSTQILINQKEDEAADGTSRNIETNQQLINTYTVLLKSPIILKKVNEALNLNMSIEDLDKKIKVNSTFELQVIGISVRDKNPIIASEIANTLATVFEEEIPKVMNVDNITILSEATVEENQSPVSPNLYLNLLIAAGAGVFLGIGLAILLNYLDTSVKDSKDVKKLLDLPVLAVISPIEQNKNKQIDDSKLALKEKEA